MNNMTDMQFETMIEYRSCGYRLLSVKQKNGEILMQKTGEKKIIRIQRDGSVR